LAKGADSLVAGIALEMGARLIVPVPMRRELYESDFTEPGTRVLFEKLIGMADSVFVLPVA
jgi:hypothetical protein